MTSGPTDRQAADNQPLGNQQIANENAQPNHAVAAVAKAYVREMLELNPMFQASDILRRRRQLWGIQPLTRTAVETGPATVTRPPDAQADEKLRSRAKQCLKVLQSDFYTLPADKRDQYLNLLENPRLPEYSALAARLRGTAGVQDALMAAESETGDVKFAYSLMYSMIRPPAEAGALKEQYIEAITNERRVKPAVKAIKLYVNAHPGVYKLQQDWLDELLDPKQAKIWARRESFATRATKSRWTAALFIFAGLLSLWVKLTSPDKNTVRDRRGIPAVAPKQTGTNLPTPIPTASNAPTRSSSLDVDAPMRTPGFSFEVNESSEPVTPPPRQSFADRQKRLEEIRRRDQERNEAIWRQQRASIQRFEDDARDRAERFRRESQENFERLPKLNRPPVQPRYFPGGNIP